MTTDDVLAVLKDRGLSVVARTDGQLVLHGPRHQATPGLLRVLRFHRQEIARRLAPPRKREWLWRTGHRSAEEPFWAFYGKDNWHPAGAWWWRYVGEERWLPVPGTPGESAEADEWAGRR